MFRFRLLRKRLHMGLAAFALVSGAGLACSQLVDQQEGPLDFIPPLVDFGDTTPPVVLRSSPAPDAPLVQQNQAITVEFSRSMNQRATESAFSLSSAAGGSLDGRFSWGGNTMVFQPRSPLTQPGIYTYTISASGAESSAGVNLLDDYVVNFAWSLDVTSPSLLGISPSDGAVGVSPSTTIVVLFSEPMDVESVLAGVSSSPDMNLNLPATIISGDQTRFEFIPLNDLSFGTNYTFSVPNTVEDLSGNPLPGSESSSFVIGGDFDNPEIASISTASVADFSASQFTPLDGFEKDEPIIVEFTKPVQLATVISGVSFSPSVAFSVTDVSGNNTRFSIAPTSNLTLEETYELQFSRDILDEQNNSLNELYTYILRINGPRSRFIRVQEVYTQTTPLANPLEDQATDFNPPCLGGGAPGVCETPIYVSFCWGTACTAPSGGLNIVQGSVDIQVTRLFGTGALSAYVSPFGDATPGAFTETFVISSQLNDMESGSTYRVIIKGGTGGVRDDNGNYMEADKVLILNYP